MEFIKSAIDVFLAVRVLYMAPLLFRIAVPLYGCHELMTFAVGGSPLLLRLLGLLQLCHSVECSFPDGFMVAFVI